MARLFCLYTCFILLATGCGGGATPPSDPDVVATSSDTSFPFAEATTYVLANNVAEITDPPSTNVKLSEETRNLILDRVESNMNERGYGRISESSATPPDIFIQVSVMRTTSTDVYYTYWPTYWGSYYDPWYGYSTGWGTVPVPYIESSTLGSLIIEFTDPNHPNEDAQEIPSIWVGIVAGAVDNETSTGIQSRIESGIDQAFEQSDYIRRQP
ncbi:MAG TPA: DUF4136 domain-containing protein [Bdellovibrionales bacterium]|nr:DUF4136 domain-containing protein [Bdellovibrionales bacterium]